MAITMNSIVEGDPKKYANYKARVARIKGLVANHGDRTRLAKRIDVSPSSITSLLNGHRVSVSTLFTIERELGLPGDPLMDAPVEDVDPEKVKV